MITKRRSTLANFLYKTFRINTADLEKSKLRLKCQRRHAFGFFAALIIMFTVLPATVANAGSNDSYVVGVHRHFGITRTTSGYVGIGCEYINKISQLSSSRFSYTADEPKALFERLLDGTIDIIPCVTERERELYEPKDINDPESIKSKIKLIPTALFSKFCTISVLSTGEYGSLNYGDEYEIRKLTIGYLLDDEKDLFPDGKFVVNGLSSANFISYASESALQTALTSGKIGAAVKDCFMHWNSESVVYKFNAAPCYFAVREQNTKLANEMTEALSDIISYYPSFNGEVYDKYISNYGSLNYNLSKEEALFVRNNPRLIIAYNLDADYSHSWDEKSETLSGAVADVFNEISKYTGLEVKVVGISGLTQCIQQLREGKVGAVFGGVPPDGISDYSGGLITSPVTSSPLVLLGKENTSPNNVSTITMVGNNPAIRDTITSFYPNAKITPLTSADIASDHVTARGYDAFCTGANTAIYLMSRRNNELELLRTFPTSVSECFAINKLQPELFGVIEKSLSQINRGTSNAEIYNLISSVKNTSPQDTSSIVLNVAVISAMTVLLVGYIILSSMEARRRSEIDVLTGGRNKRRFIKDSEKAAKKFEPENLAVAVFDIDKFKFVNERIGYEEGNRVLTRLHNTISDNIKKGEVFARIVNDSFAITMLNASDLELTTRLNDIFSEFTRRNAAHTSLPISFSAGICRLSDCKQKGIADPNVAIDRCSIAKKTVKDRRGNGIAFYDSKIREKELREKDYENEMPNALNNHEFACFLQPKYGTKSRHIEGAEALIRWQSKEYGFVYPSDFIPISEKNGFVIELDFFILEEVCRLMRKWLDSGLTPVVISVNQSRLHLDEPDYIGKLREIVDKYEIPYKYIELELTESVFTDNADLMIKTMQKLHDVGFKLSIDDFGSGYSSLNMLKDMPADVVKIDREFFNTTANTQKGRAVISSVVDLANNLNMKVISEGVETEEQVEFLADIGCHMVQGFFFAKPMTVKDFEELWEKDRNGDSES